MQSSLSSRTNCREFSCIPESARKVPCGSRALRVALFAVLLWPFATVAQGQDAFAPSGRLWGYVFGDYYYKAAGEDAGWGTAQYARMGEGMHAAELRRLYLGYDYRFTTNVSSRVLLESNDDATFANGSYGIFLKLGYLAWEQPLSGLPLTLNVGLIPTPVFAYPERAWGYRSIEKETLNLRGIGRSVDFGASIVGRFDADDRFGYTLMVGNNSGTRPAQDARKAVYVSTNAAFLDRRFNVELMGSRLPTARDGVINVGRVFLGVDPGWASFGLETAFVRDEAPREIVATSDETVSRLLVSVFTTIPVTTGPTSTRIFLRYDYFDPDLDFDVSKAYARSDAFYAEHLIIAGVQFQPVPRVYVMPNLWTNYYRERGAGASRAVDIVPRVTLYFVY
jgi:hypothetical protein